MTMTIMTGVILVDAKSWRTCTGSSLRTGQGIRQATLIAVAKSDMRNFRRPLLSCYHVQDSVRGAIAVP